MYATTLRVSGRSACLAAFGGLSLFVSTWCTAQDKTSEAPEVTVAALGTSGSHKPTLDRPMSDAVAPGTFEQLLAMPQMKARLGAWGLGVDDVQHLLSVMPDDQRQRLWANWQLLSVNSRKADALDSTAMYLALVTRMRNARLFVSVISNRF